MSNFITHNSTSPPELAPAALVVVSRLDGVKVVQRVDQTIWTWVNEYRPLTNDEGHKLISAEGLEDWAMWVTTDEDGDASQFSEKPQRDVTWMWHGVSGLSLELPDTNPFRHPGDWRDSLYRVESK